MNASRPWVAWFGFGLNALLAALILMAGVMKILNLIPPEGVEKMNETGIGAYVQIIGWGESIAALLLIVPLTAPLGTLLTSGFWGGVIVAHMFQQEGIVFPSVLLALTWLGAWLRGHIRFLAPASNATR